MLYMVIERFRDGPAAVYERLRRAGRQAPDGLRYVASWVTVDTRRCFQLMECADRRLLDVWMAAWEDLVEFDVVEVMPSADAQRLFEPGDQ